MPQRKSLLKAVGREQKKHAARGKAARIHTSGLEKMKRERKAQAAQRQLALGGETERARSQPRTRPAQPGGAPRQRISLAEKRKASERMPVRPGGIRAQQAKEGSFSPRKRPSRPKRVARPKRAMLRPQR